MAEEEKMMSGEQFAQRRNAAPPSAAQAAHPASAPPGPPLVAGAPGRPGPVPNQPGAALPPVARPPADPRTTDPRTTDPRGADPRGADPRGDRRGAPPAFEAPPPASRSNHTPPGHSYAPPNGGPPLQPARRAGGPTAPPEPERPGPVSADEFLEARHRSAKIGPATWGWRGAVRRLTGGLFSPQMGAAEQEYTRNRSLVQRSFEGPRTIVFVNPKGGAAKTTSVLMSGFTFGTVRGGGVVAWDNNETRGTLGVRGTRANHNNTARELLAARERFSDVFSARLGDLGGYVRSQGEAHFDLLASDEQPGVTGTIHADDFASLHQLLNRFYRIVLIDTGNNIRAENWLSAVDKADLLVVTTTVREDTGYSGLWMLDALVAEGREDLVAKSITILSDPAASVDKELAASLTQAYGSRSRQVCRVPFDASLVAGSVVDYGGLSKGTREAWLGACAAMAEAL